MVRLDTLAIDPARALNMAGWFSRALSGGGRQSEAEPVVYAITCGCGNVLTGVRSKRMQVALCKNCASQICVLPISPYPRPKIRPAKKTAKKVPPLIRLREEADQDEADQTPAPLSRQTAKSRKPPATDKARRGVQSPTRTAGAKSTDTEWPPPSVRRPLLTPLRMVTVGMLVVMSLAGWWISHRRAVNQAVRIYSEESKAGRAALSKLDFEAADLHLGKAALALDLLGRNDRDARQVRQLAGEAAAANGLALISLFELMSEAQQARVMTPADWRRALQNNYRGSWFLIETNGMQFVSGDKFNWQFTVPLAGSGEPVQIHGDLSKWATLLTKPPTHAILAGQLDEIRPVDNGKGWELVLKKDSLCLWTSEETWSALGGSINDETRATLKSQAQLLGVSE